MSTGKHTGKRPLVRLWHKWADNIRMGVKEIGTNKGNFVNSSLVRDYLRFLCELDIELPGSISHGVSLYIFS